MNKIEIEIPEGKIAEMEKNSDSIKITFKSIATKPRSWEEYCKYSTRFGKFLIGDDSVIRELSRGFEDTHMILKCDKNLLPSEELAEAFLAMMQLMSLRQAWIGDWEPDWKDEYAYKYCIIGKYNDFIIYPLGKLRYPLSFPTEEMAKDFINTFKDLLEIAKLLI